ncbi:NAD-dependent epimerase/dehydratase family protein [Psychrobacter glacincola]|uniref:NAD-dependent epimerase/dehydratase family protein n=1 Tax=Psychrobacter glacincola TaxID=56810 RepID=A0ABW1W5V4_9GAMM|nr:NAD(P)-dependent oxidoreductase [Psychrobacter glacincola]
MLTGASGFIGSHILSQLTKILGKESVVALTSIQIPNINCIIYNTIQNFGLHSDQFDDITHIIHAGAFIPKDRQKSDDMKKCYENLEFTQELLSFDYKKLKRIINLSTIDVYKATSEILSEDSLIEPVSLYGLSKLYCEAMVHAFARERKLESLNLRIGHVYGPGEEKYKKVMPITISNILQGKPVELWGDGSDLRSFIFVQDVVQAIINALETNVEYESINVVSGNAVSIKHLLQKIIAISGKIVIVNYRESNHQKRNLVFDNRLLTSTLLEKETDLSEGLKIEYEYIREKNEFNL